MRKLNLALFGAFTLVMLLALSLPVLYGRQSMHAELLEEVRAMTMRETRVLGQLLDARPDLANRALQEFVQGLNSNGIRATFVNSQGRVLADSSSASLDQAMSLPAHGDRPEIVQALRHGQGSAIRYSSTLEKDLVYAAVALEASGERPQGVLRLAVPFAGIASRVDGLAGGLALCGLAVVLLALYLSRRFLNRLDTSIQDMITVVEQTGRNGVRRPTLPPREEFYALNAAVSAMTDRVEGQLNTIAAQKAELESVLNSMEEGVLVIGARGRIARVNPALFRLFPTMSRQVEDRLPVEVLPEPALQNILDELLVSTGEQSRHITLTLGRERTLAVHFHKPAQTKNAVRVVVVLHDVTEMAHLLRVKRDLVANVSHELRTPLTAIQGYAETLLEMEIEGANQENAADRRRRFLEIIAKHSSQMAHLVDDLLTLSRLENGEEPVEGSCNAVDALNDALEECRIPAAARNVRFRSLLEGPVLVQADRGRLSQVWRNLLENACRYAPENTEVVISAGHEAAPQATGQEICFSVQDFGPGIPAAELAHIFERFYQVEKHRGGGTGLGLAICKHIVERLGGQIWAEYAASPLLAQSASRVGATLRFTLPLYENNGDAQ